MQNIELKIELRDPAAAVAQCRVLDAQHIGTLHQIDNYFQLTDGRLKRREAAGEPVVWIYYHRPDRARPRLCNYTILSDEQARRRWGTKSLTSWLQVIKTRDLWMLRNVRIHLDDVETLGRFIEFEAMVGRDCGVLECHQAIARLRTAFAPVIGEPVAVSYSDLMEQLKAAGEPGEGDR